MQHLYVVCEEGANYLKYIHTNIHSIDLLVCPKKTGFGTSQLHTNICHFYSIIYYKHFTKLYFRSYLHKKNSSSEYKEWVFKYFIKVTYNFAFSFLGVSDCMVIG